MAKPKRRSPNKTEKLAAVLLMLKRGDGWLIPEPLRSNGTAEEICRYPEWHHEARFAIRPDHNPRMLTPLAPEDHRARFARDMKEIAKVKRGLKRKLDKVAPITAAWIDDPAPWMPPPRRKPKRPMPGSKASPWRKRMDGTVERRA